MHTIKTIFLTRQRDALKYTIQLSSDEAGRYFVSTRSVGEFAPRHQDGLSQALAEALVSRIQEARQREGFQDASIALESESSFEAFANTLPNESTGKVREALVEAFQKKTHPDVLRTLPVEKRRRLIWQLGEYRIKTALPFLLSYRREKRDPLLEYSLCWALGRIAEGNDHETLLFLDDLRTQGQTEAIQHIATLAWLRLADTAAQEAHARTLIENWPAPLRTLWEASAGVLDTPALQPAFSSRFSQAQWLQDLDQVAEAPSQHAKARQNLLAHLDALPFAFGSFRTLRRLYKAAEFRMDGELLGRLHFRFENTPHRPPEQDRRRKSQNVYGYRTRQYFRKRTWRTLRRLGRFEDPAFIRLALGVLVAFDDKAAKTPSIETDTVWDNTIRNWRSSRYHCAGESSWILFYRLLYLGSTRWTLNSVQSRWRWANNEPLNPAYETTVMLREEAFPALWDQYPEALLWLMQRSHSTGVQHFAARALLGRTDFISSIASHVLCELIQLPYTSTVRFAFSAIETRIGNASTREEVLYWLIQLTQVPLEEAHRFVLDKLSADPEHYATSAPLITATLTAPDDRIRKLGRLLLQFSKGNSALWQDIISAVLDGLDIAESWTPALPAILQDLTWVIQNPLKEAASVASQTRLIHLLYHPVSEVVCFAAQWLIIHSSPVANIPPAVLQHLLASDDNGRCRAGVTLFSALPFTIILTQVDLVARFCEHPDAKIRESVLLTLDRLALEQPAGCADFAYTLSQRLIDTLFRSEAVEGVHADLIKMLGSPLFSEAINNIDIATHLRLITAKSKGAQQCGDWLLSKRTFTDFSVRECAMLARMPMQSTRAWACEAYRAHPERMVAEMEEALRIFDSRWDDTLEFASAFFSERGAWTTSLLISLCDHSHPTVQSFGAKLVNQHSTLGDVVEYLLKLSQHPSVQLQTLVADWLSRVTLDDVDQLRALRPYFLSVLSQVNRARVAKNRVLGFLRAEALRSETAANFVIDLFTRLVLTVSIADKSQYLEGLEAIRAHYPALHTPLQACPPRSYTPRHP